jgi:hypothetical protein
MEGTCRTLGEDFSPKNHELRDYLGYIGVNGRITETLILGK